MGNSILYRMGNGVAGDLTRQSQATIEPHVLGATPFAGFGLFAKIAANKAVPVGAGDAAAVIYGLLIRPYPTQGANASDPLGTAVPATAGMVDILKRGYAAVKVNGAAAPAHGGIVYIRVAAAAGGKPIGGIEAAADGGNTIIVGGCIFMGAADADGIAEIAFNI